MNPALLADSMVDATVLACRAGSVVFEYDRNEV